jgi:hypothetical protein
MTLSDKNSTCNTTLYLGLSIDGVQWWLREGELLPRSASGWDNEMIYRSTGFVQRSSSNETLRIWYSARSTSGKWRIGYTKSRLNVSALMLARAQLGMDSNGKWYRSIDNSTMIWTSEPEPAPIKSNDHNHPGDDPSTIDPLAASDMAYRLDVANDLPGKASITKCNISSLGGRNLSWGSLVIIEIHPSDLDTGINASRADNDTLPYKVDHGKYVLVKDENIEVEDDDRPANGLEEGEDPVSRMVIWMLPLVISLFILASAVAREEYRILNTSRKTGYR